MNEHARFSYFQSAPGETSFDEYIGLRQRVFRAAYPSLPDYFGQEDEADHISNVLLASDGCYIVGGARLTISRPGRPLPLPMEDGEFSLKDHEPVRHLDLHRQPYGEISRMAVDPRCPAREVSCTLGRLLCQVAARQGVDLIFSICPDGPARINRGNAKKCGVGFALYPKLPTAFGIDMWLCSFTGVLEVKTAGDEEAMLWGSRGGR